MPETAAADRSLGRLSIPQELYAPLAHFVARAGEVLNLRAAVLFGSAVTGEFRRKSDIDILLLFDTDHNPELGPEAESALALAAEIASHYNLAHSFSFVMENLRDGALDPHFLWETAREGIVIWADPALILMPEPRSALEPALLVTYSTQGMTSKDKGALHRALYGYRVEKKVGNKVYVSEKPGLIEKTGQRLGPGVVVVPARIADRLTGLLEKHGASYTTMKVWR